MTRRRPGRTFAAYLLLAVAIHLELAASPEARAEGASLEPAIKATYLYKFAPFVEWPAPAFDEPSSPITLCAFQDGLGDLIERAVEGQRVGQRPIVVRRPARIERGTGCHILYIGAGASPSATAAALDATRGTPVLTVTDGAAPVGTKPIVNFVVDRNRVRFEIDTLAAAENGIAISSKLLSLALNVTPRP